MASSTTQPSFRKVPLASIRTDSIADFDIHICTGSEHVPILFREKQVPVTAAAISSLVEHRHRYIYVPAAQEAEYCRYVDEHLDAILNDPELLLNEKCEVLYDSAQSLVARILDEPRSRELLHRSKELVASAIYFMMQEQGAFSYLVHLVSYDYQIYTHSVNVSIFSVSLAQRAGISAFETLRDLGEGTLLHDIGKSMLDPSITKCRGELTPEKWKAMKMHPVYGHEILSANGMLGDICLDIVRHHHENIDGTGYPDGLVGQEIAPLVRITTIADIFDALTTRRTYHDAMDSFSALKLMKKEMANGLDMDLYHLFVELMGTPDR